MSGPDRWRRLVPRLAVGLVLGAYVIWIDPLLGDLAQSWALENDASALWLFRVILLVFVTVFAAVVWWGFRRRRNTATMERGRGG